MTAASPLRILLVCTANICRSPMAEAFVADRLTARGIAAVVGSAGFLMAGQPASELTMEVMAERGFDLSGHVSRLVSVDLVRDSDLVLTMERRHARELLVSAGEGTPVHTLKGFVRLAARIEPDHGSPTDWLAAVAAAETQEGLLGDGLPDEISDPHGQPIARHRRAADEIAAAAGAVAILLAGVACKAPR